MIGIIIFIIGFGAVLIFPFVTIQFLYETYENFLKMTKDLNFSALVQILGLGCYMSVGGPSP